MRLTVPLLSFPARRFSSERFPFSWPASPSLLVRRLRVLTERAPARRALAAEPLVAVADVAVDVVAAVAVAAVPLA
jgi:hypothetical protein